MRHRNFICGPPYKFPVLVYRINTCEIAVTPRTQTRYDSARSNLGANVVPIQEGPVHFDATGILPIPLPDEDEQEAPMCVDLWNGTYFSILSFFKADDGKPSEARESNATFRNSQSSR
jgi:hypothetical protein